MAAIVCEHTDATETGEMCCHLLEKKDGAYYQRFSGVGKTYALVCEACYQQQEQIASCLRVVCLTCFQEVAEKGYWAGILGKPQVLERPSILHFANETIQLATPLSERIMDIQPIDAHEQPIWVALTASGSLVSVDLARRLATPLAQLPSESVNLQVGASLHLARDGSMAAVVNTLGQAGVVVDLKTGVPTMSLKRGTYHMNVSPFPVAFFALDGQLLLIHATDWNRLEVSDPRTGNVVTNRPKPTIGPDHKRPDHYLDYFHCSLVVSPNQEWVAEDGWIWQPEGIVNTWNLRRWVLENAWESEDGPSKKRSYWRENLWCVPLCWIDGQALAVWGYGEDANWLLPAVRLLDVVSGKELRWFPAPDVTSEKELRWFTGTEGLMVFDAYLFSVSEWRGISVWDIATGERLLHEPVFSPWRYHRGAKQFLTLLPDGAFQLSRLVDKASG